LATWYTPSTSRSEVYFSGFPFGYSLGNPNFNVDFAPGLLFGTNSTSGLWTINNYYYP